MGDADLAEAVAVGEIGDGSICAAGGIAGHAAVGLQRDGDDGVARLAWAATLLRTQRAKAGCFETLGVDLRRERDRPAR